MDPKLELVRSWLEKARRDLESADRLGSGTDPLLDTAVYHCQQAAEKAIKGWLVFHDKRVEKTHDLRLLVSFAENIDPEFSQLYDAAEVLTPFATLYRYPGEMLAPQQEEFSQALTSAETFVSFIEGHLDR
jgi:HEPN domain-containing protein